MFVLNEARSRELVALPESGMGYQLVEFMTDDNRRHEGIAFNAEYLIGRDEPRTRLIETATIALAKVELLAGKPHAVVREIRLLEQARGSALGFGVREAGSPYGAKTAPAQDAPVELTRAGEVFVRFSAYADDKRVLADGSIAAGTFATTAGDAVHVQTGKQAVMRYALPNSDPAVNRFILRPPEPAPIQYGTAQPAYGQPGGGVEVLFRAGSAPRTLVHRDKIPLG